MSAPSRFRLVDGARQRTGMTVEQLWLGAFALGGFATLFELDAYLNGLASLDEFEQDVLAIVVNESLDDLVARYRVPLDRLEPDIQRAVEHLLELGPRLPPASAWPGRMLPR